MGDMTAQATVRLRAQRWDLVVRPRTALVRSTALSIVFSAVPLAVALVWVSFPIRLWAVMATVVLVVALVVAVVAVRIGTAFVGVDDATVTVRSVLSPGRSVRRDDVQRLVLVETFGSSVDRTVRALVALAEDGAPLFRLRADVWGQDGLDRVVDALGVTVSEEPRPLSARELARRWPTGRAWYERTAAVLWVGLAAVVVVGAVLAVETVGLIGA